MRRRYAAGILAVPVLAILLLTLLRPGALVGAWETEVQEGGMALVLRYDFGRDGAYRCSLTRAGDALEQGVSMEGQYAVLKDRLFLSEGAGYQIDPAEYDLYLLEGDTLTLLDNARGDAGGLYPLVLTRAAEN